MALYQLKRTQRLKTDIETAWQFFSHPTNLGSITPPHMKFEILSTTGSNNTFAGQIITYRISPIAGVPLFWMTEITHLQHHCYFVDEQRTGPYAFWHHLHRFTTVPGGIEMEDIVHYSLPLGWLGRLVHYLWVRRQIEHIFNYRYNTLKQKFGEL